MAAQSNQTPSELLRIEDHVNRTYGVDGWWTCIQFDQAVIGFGRTVEGLLNQYDDKGKPKHTLEGILLRGQRMTSTPKSVTQFSRSDSRIVKKSEIGIRKRG